MEQRTGTSSQPLKTEPVTGAGFDPAFIPGITPPRREEPQATAPEDADPQEQDEQPQAKAPEAADTDTTDAATTAGQTADDASAGESTADETDEKPTAEDPSDDQSPDGPLFEAADRRARIVADHQGIRLSLDDQECDFRWDEIGAVETTVPRFGKRYTVTVHTPERRWYPIEIDAPSKARVKEWDTQLDAVLDAYFDDGEGEAEQGAEGEQSAEADKKAEASGKAEADRKTGEDRDGKSTEAPAAPHTNEAAADDADKDRSEPSQDSKQSAASTN